MAQFGIVNYTELKDSKKECLVEIIDVLDEPEAADYVIKERVLEAAIQMIRTNLFRTFANKSKFRMLQFSGVI